MTTVGSEPPILISVAAYYTSKLQLHGATPRGVDWNGARSHELRHQQFLRLLDGSAESSILDLGCGYGDFLRFLRHAGHRGAFVGYDIAPAMIEEARRIHGDGPDRQWHVGAEPHAVVDFAVASGIFNVKGDVPQESWERYVYETIETLASVGRAGFAFNVLSLSSDPERRSPNLYYADPGVMLSHCLRKYGRAVALMQDYGLHEFTMIVRRI